jgi:hypothetical protein
MARKCGGWFLFLLPSKKGSTNECGGVFTSVVVAGAHVLATLPPLC